MKKNIFLVLLFSFLIFSACDLLDPKEKVIVSGKLEKLQASVWQYGSHILKNNEGKLLYALESSKIKLDNYAGQIVYLEGSKIEGYPVEGGPLFLEVNIVRKTN